MDSHNFSDYLHEKGQSSGFGDSLNNGNKSFTSTYSNQSLATINTASSSKAVLAALKALQDKIRLLETERSQALDEISALKLQMKNQEIENENARQKEILNNQKLLQESKLSYDRLVYEKNDMESKLNKILEKNHSMSDLSNNLQMKIQMLEDDKNSLLNKLKDMEFENSQLELQIKHSQLHEKEIATSLASETRRNNEEIQGLQSQIIHLQSVYQDTLLERESLQSKTNELDALVEQLLKLNESLITQLSGKPFKFHSKLGSSSVKKSSSSKSVPAIENIAAEASKLLLKSLEKKGPSTSKSLSKTLESIEQMKLMHKIYSDIARKMNTSVKRRSLSPKKSSASLLSSSSNRNNFTESDYEDTNYDSTASGSKKTRIKMKKQNSSNSLASSNVLSTPTSSTKVKKTKSALKRSNSNYTNVTNVTGDFTFSDDFPSSSRHGGAQPPQPPSNHHDIVLPRANMNNNNNNVSFDDRYQQTQSSLPTPPQQQQQQQASSQDDYLRKYAVDYSSVLNNNNGKTSSNNNNSSSFKGNASSASFKPSVDMNEKISQLEDEFNQLNLQYLNLISTVKADTNNLNTDQLNSENIQSHAQDIVNVITKLHEKGEQIRLLKSPTKF